MLVLLNKSSKGASAFILKYTYILNIVIHHCRQNDILLIYNEKKMVLVFVFLILISYKLKFINKFLHNEKHNLKKKMLCCSFEHNQ